jgi:hypothetical protein
VHIIGDTDDQGANEIRTKAKQYWDGIANNHLKKEDLMAMRKAKVHWTGKRSSLFDGLSGSAFLSVSLGRVLIGFDPNRPGIEEFVQKRVATIVKNARSRNARPRTEGRASWKGWLKTIAEFERLEMSRPINKIRDDQLFARYRRKISPWIWPD